ncbi:MAG: serine/threonine protein kinase [Myxococcales bacterium]|nr:serine/threonine protein kinase [Myxococcales bacterium]
MQTIGPYRVIRTIGVGGMGEVFLCALERAGGFEKRVAVKRARGEGAPLELFEREARLAALLDHRHIVQIFDFGRDDEGAWLAMEYVQGVDLKAVLDLGEPVPPGLALEVGVACARGLAFAHRATDTTGRPLGIVHRDVSPHNVLLSFQGDVKLGDFGVALATARAGDAVAVHGKLAYMSPEQARGEGADPRSDLYALGVVLYELLAGRRCFFDGGDPAALARRVRAGAPLQPLAQAAPALPAALVAVIDQALATDPAARFADGEALAEALLAAAAQAGIVVGAPALGPWLAARFDRAGRGMGHSAGPRAAEATATAAAPIEATATAAVPAGGSGTPPPPLEATPAQAAEGPRPPRRRGVGLALLLATAGLGAWWVWPAGTRPVAPGRGRTLA